MTNTAIAASKTTSRRDRIANRRRVALAGRLTWRDASGTLRFASVMTRDLSDLDVYVECQVPTTIPLFRLVHFQLERPGRDLPFALQQGKVLAAVYRVGPYKSSSGTPHGYALRLLVEPARMAATERMSDRVVGQPGVSRRAFANSAPIQPTSAAEVTPLHTPVPEPLSFPAAARA